MDKIDTSSLLAGMVISAVGAGYILYGRKQKKYVWLACGIGMIIIPMAISDNLTLIGIGAALMVIPYFVSA